MQARLTESLFVFPPWLAVGVPLFVGALTMLAAFYPARRAARVNPVARLDRPRGRETLARMTYPSVDESFARLRCAGWSVGGLRHRRALGRQQEQRGERHPRPGPGPGGGVVARVRAGASRGHAGAGRLQPRGRR